MAGQVAGSLLGSVDQDAVVEDQASVDDPVLVHLPGQRQRLLHPVLGGGGIVEVAGDGIEHPLLHLLGEGCIDFFELHGLLHGARRGALRPARRQ